MDWLFALVLLLVVGLVVTAIVVARRRSGPSEVGESDAVLRQARLDAEARRTDPDVREWDGPTR
jgi:hypothetical protein